MTLEPQVTKYLYEVGHPDASPLFMSSPWECPKSRFFFLVFFSFSFFRSRPEKKSPDLLLRGELASRHNRVNVHRKEVLIREGNDLQGICPCTRKAILDTLFHGLPPFKAIRSRMRRYNNVPERKKNADGRMVSHYISRRTQRLRSRFLYTTQHNLPPPS